MWVNVTDSVEVEDSFLPFTLGNILPSEMGCCRFFKREG